MLYFLITLAIFFIVMLLMMVGVLLQNKEIKGSCGGLKDFSLSQDSFISCEICGSKNPLKDCQKEAPTKIQSSL